jgi:hypothetical protein
MMVAAAMVHRLSIAFYLAFYFYLGHKLQVHQTQIIPKTNHLSNQHLSANNTRAIRVPHDLIDPHNISDSIAALFFGKVDLKGVI